MFCLFLSEEEQEVCEDDNEAVAAFGMGECPDVVAILAGMGLIACDSDLTSLGGEGNIGMFCPETCGLCGTTSYMLI